MTLSSSTFRSMNDDPGNAVPQVPSQNLRSLGGIGPDDFRNALLCGLAVLVAVMITWPFCEFPYNDDWSYSFTVKHLLQTHQLTYNGWASASLIAQAYWGLLWVKVFGFSYTILRISTIPLATIAISICYLLARHAGLKPRFAVFATLMLGLSPLYLPVACTFMTDAPGLFFIMLCMYAMVRALESPRTSHAIAWLCIGLTVGLVGGTGRQIVWVVPMVFAPYIAWIRRDNLPILVCCIFGWVLVFAGALLTMRWFAHQPFSVPETSLKVDLQLALRKKAHYIISVLGIGLTLIWVILPALWGLTKNWNPTRALLALVLFIGPAIILPMRPRYAVAPWMGNTLSFSGVMGGAELSGNRPVAMPKVVRIISAVVVFAVACILICDLLIRLTRPLTTLRKTRDFLLFPRPGEAVIPAMLLFALAYVVLLLPRCATDMVYDRYMLPIMPCVLFPILLKYQKRGESTVPPLALILFGIYAIYGICITQDVTALARARAVAINRLVAAGHPKKKSTPVLNMTVKPNWM